MKNAQRFVIIGGAALALFLGVSLAPSPAFARRGHWHWRGHARVYAPAVGVHVHTYPAHPAPTVYYPGPSTVYYPAPAPTQAVVVHHHDPVGFGLSLGGLAHAPSSGQLPVGGVVGALQFRTSSHSLLVAELQSMSAHRLSDDTRRRELAGLIGGRVFFWNRPLAPYFEAAAGLGRTSMEVGGFEVRDSQLLARYGLGLELRLGRHLVLEGQASHVHKLRLEPDDGVAYEPVSLGGDQAVRDHERAVEVRAALSFRF